MDFDEKFMRRCLQLAEYGKGYVAPNPLVGAVVVYNGKIIGEGFHRRFGESHAEVNAIRSVRRPELLKDATLYVNLEPCSHHGNTPPCADLIIEKQIPRVVNGMIDPFPRVSGKGLEKLRNVGVEVISGILEAECRRLNRRFIKFQTAHRPYIILKWAQSSDGFIDRFRQAGDGQKPVRFSDDFMQVAVHKIRAEESAIMVGSRTMELDKPQLNVRFWAGNSPRVVRPVSNKTLAQQMNELYEQQIQSLLVEGGSQLLQSFIAENLWDEAQVEIHSIRLNAGVKAPQIAGVANGVRHNEHSFVISYIPY